MYISCPDESNEFYEGCKDTDKDVSHAVPVCTNRYVFRNIYCALCRGFGNNDVNFFSMLLGDCYNSSNVDWKSCKSHVLQMGECENIALRRSCQADTGEYCDSIGYNIGRKNTIACKSYQDLMYRDTIPGSSSYSFSLNSCMFVVFEIVFPVMVLVKIED